MSDLMPQLSILVIDDDPKILRSVGNYLEARGHAVALASGGTEGLAVLERMSVDIVITDVQMPEMDGFEVLERVQAVSPGTEVIVITGFGDVERAMRAMRAGAFDFFSKPFTVQDLSAALQRTVRFRELRREKERYAARLARLSSSARAASGLEAIVGQSAAIGLVREQVRQVAGASDTSVLIGGETGTGKELVARAIHYESGRADGPFVAVDCSAIPEPLVESVFYGHVKGAFTDARSDHIGHFEAADGGTLFLDEIGDMDPAMQAKLLRTLEERRVRRVGSTREVEVDVRVVSATNKALPQAIAAGVFRQDLYYRLNAFHIELPALRERVEDIPLLAQHYLRHYTDELHGVARTLDAGVEALLQAHAFPGNVRELRNLMERAAIVCTDEVLTRVHVHLDPPVVPAVVEATSAVRHGPVDLRELVQSLAMAELDLDVVQRAVIEEALRRAYGNQVQAAKYLGLSRDALRRRMDKYELL
jgi:two-component system response regulator AtoC